MRRIVAKRARVPIGSVMLCSALALAGCAQAERDTAARIDALMRPYAGAIQQHEAAGRYLPAAVLIREARLISRRP